MARYYIHNNTGVGYVVACMEENCEGYLSCRFVRNFGDRQTDAIEFRDDCNNGKIDERRLKLLKETYTEQPYKYMGKGIIRKKTEQ